MFEDATFHSSDIHPTQTPRWMLLALTINLAVFTAMIVVPLLYPNSLPTRILMRTLYAPAPAPIQLSHTPVASAANHTIQLSLNPFQAPRQTPSRMDTTPDAAPANSDPFSGTAPSNETPGATPSTTVFHSAPQPVVHPVPSRITKISEGVAKGLLLEQKLPTYPILARTTHTSGTVVLAATISTTGTIENLRVLSGSPMLTTAAVEAVKTWRYRPYLLNNQPIEVETTINVVFSTGSR